MRRTLLWWGLIGGVVAVVVLSRFLSLRQGGPPGIDAGNWLGFGRGLFGDDLRGADEVYPPVVPFLLLAAVSTLGLTDGVAVVAALASVGPAVGAFAAMRRLGIGVETASWCCAPLLLAAAVSEPAAWGGFPQLLGLASVPLALSAMVSFLSAGGLLKAAATGSLALLVALSSHLVFAFFCVSAAVLVAVSVAGKAVAWRKLGAAPLALAIVLPAAPLYAKLTSQVGATFASRPGGERLPRTALVGVATFVARDNVVFWACALAIGLVACIWLVRRRRSGIWRVAVSLNLTAGAAWLLLQEYRVAYFLPVAAVFGIALVANELGDLRRMSSAPRWTIRISMVVIIGLQAVAALRLAPQQGDRYRLMDRDLVSEIAYIRDSTPRRSVIGVPACRGLPLGWWVEGAGARRTLTGSDARWLNFVDERRRAMRIAELVAPPFPAQAIVTGPAEVDYVLVTRRCHPELFAVAVTAASSSLPVAHQTPSTLLIAVPAS